MFDWKPICATAILGIAVAGCQPGNTFVPPPPPVVTVAEPLQREVAQYIEFTGTSQAAATVELRARVAGYLEEIQFKDGAMVKEGDLLMALDKAPFETALMSAEAALEKAKATLQLRQAQLGRNEQLFKRSATSREELDIARAERETATADVHAAEASVRQAKLNLSYTEIHAPLTGRIGRHLVDIGGLVQAEQTMLAKIEAVDPIHVYFNVSESDLLRYMQSNKGQPLRDLTTNPRIFELSLGEASNYQWEGKLDYREFGVESGTGTTVRRAVFPNGDLSLVPGLFVRVRTVVQEPQPRLLVEERAIATDQRGDFLRVVNDKNVVENRLVKLGVLQDGLRVIEEGIKSGDRVVVNGLQRARPGATVQPENAQMGEGIANRESALKTAAREGG